MTELLLGDVVERLREFGDESFDGVLTDTPYGIGILDMSWDRAFTHSESTSSLQEEGSYTPAASLAYQRWCREWGRELLRVVKPGGHLLAFGSPRTCHRLACGLEDAGWKIRDTISYLHGQGFPTSLDIAKAIDTRLGAKREVIGHRKGVGTPPRGHGYKTTCPVTVPSTQAARRWDAYGTALKPAFEPILVAMRPVEGSYAKNAMFHGVAGLNINGCRVGNDLITQRQKDMSPYHGNRLGAGLTTTATGVETQTTGRYPANVILGHHPECRQTGVVEVPGYRINRHLDGAKPFGGGAGHPFLSLQTPPQVLTAFDCHPDCPVGNLRDKARFFYCPKPSKAEKNAGLDTSSDPDVRNDHPTVKPIELTTYLAKLILPPQRQSPRKLLVPFCGSGSEIIGGMKAGWEDVIGIDNNADYLEIARARIAHAKNVDVQT